LSNAGPTWTDPKYDLVSAVTEEKGTSQEIMDEVWKRMTGGNEEETKHLKVQRDKNSISRNKTPYFI
jgi:hypothetical protein